MTNTGLTSLEANKLLNQYGLNQLPSKQITSAWKLLLQQFKNLLSWLLIVASAISFLIGDRIDAYLIFFILILNSALSFWQEYKASKELEALRKLEVSNTRVIRDGQEVRINASLLVPGDLILLEGGDKIPADCTLLETTSLSVNEASLTGEAVPVLKSLAEPDNQLFFGTSIVGGHARARVDLTGVNTRFGKIALTLATVEEEPTPLEINLAKLGQQLALISLISAGFIFILGLWHGESLVSVFFTSTALMVAAVPEGLPSIITIILSIGVHRMYKAKTLVRKMSAIESLGAATIICTDKTGTLTKNEMKVKDSYVDPALQQDLLTASVICNTASLVMVEDGTKYNILGDTTEGALLIWAKDQGQDYTAIRSMGQIIEESPFSLETRRMSVLWKQSDQLKLFSKGAPEAILSLCELAPQRLEELTAKYKDMAASGLRVLAVAQKTLPQNSNIAESESSLQFLGFVGEADTIHEGIKEAIATAKKAGIKTIMITGDNELTARAIAHQVGLLSQGDEIVSGAQLEEISDQELDSIIPRVRIFARTAPQQKLRIIQSLQRLGEVVAVTGDGVNDSLALKQAHVGIAMGVTGTDVAKESADLIILDDNYSTIVSAIEQGRLIYSNIAKSTRFLLAGNLSEVLIVLVASLLALPTPLLPVQILWINFVTDGFPALALAADTPSRHVMSSPPRDKNAQLLGQSSLWFILSAGLVISLLVLIIYSHNLASYGLEFARTSAFAISIFLQMILVFIIRRHHSITSNKYLLMAVTFVAVSTLAIISFQPLRELFKFS